MSVAEQLRQTVIIGAVPRASLTYPYAGAASNPYTDFNAPLRDGLADARSFSVPRGGVPNFELTAYERHPTEQPPVPSNVTGHPSNALFTTESYAPHTPTYCHDSFRHVAVPRTWPYGMPWQASLSQQTYAYPGAQSPPRPVLFSAVHALSPYETASAMWPLVIRNAIANTASSAMLSCSPILATSSPSTCSYASTSAGISSCSERSGPEERSSAAADHESQSQVSNSRRPPRWRATAAERPSGKIARNQFYPCEICARKFSTASSMVRHLRIHNDDRKFKCSLPGCTRAFTDSSNRRRHEATQH